MTYRIRPAERRDLPALTALAHAQADARHVLDPRLPAGAQLIPFLSDALTLADVLAWRGHATFVAEHAGEVMGGVNLHKVEQSDGDPFASYYPRRFTSLGLLAAQADAPATVVTDLLTCAADQAARWRTSALLMHNASADRAMNAVLRLFGFRTYYHYALREATPTSAMLQFTEEGDGFSSAVLHPERSGAAAKDYGGDPLVRLATRRDLDAVVRIGMESVHYHASLERTMQVARSEPQKMRRRFDQAMGEPNQSAIFVAEVERVVAGFYSIYTQAIDDSWTPPLFAAGRYGLIAEVAVAEPLRHRGIGRKIFAAVNAWFQARDVERYWLIYLPHNPLSSKFWLSLGFEPVWDVLLKDEG